MGIGHYTFKLDKLLIFWGKVGSDVWAELHVDTAKEPQAMDGWTDKQTDGQMNTTKSIISLIAKATCKGPFINYHLGRVSKLSGGIGLKKVTLPP